MTYIILGLLLLFAGIVYYVYLVGSEWMDRAERELDHWPSTLEPPPLRISGGVYDAIGRGDFE